jgi:hypothetical protein
MVARCCHSGLGIPRRVRPTRWRMPYPEARGAEADCVHHPDQAATEACDRCGERFCDRCIGFTMDGRLCVVCATRARTRRAWRTVGLAGLAVIAAGALITLLLVTHKPAVRPDTAIESDEVATVRRARERLAAEPCDRRAIVELADARLRLKLHADVIATNRAWVTRCGVYRYLDWKTLHAHKQLGQWQEALTVVDAILADGPRDSDYWWWRGEVYDELGQPAIALADYRQSIANSDDARAGRYAAGRMVEAAGRAGRGCELVAALRYFVEELGGELRPEHEDAQLAVEREQRCRARVSGTKGSLPRATATRPAQVTGRIAGHAGRFLVEERTGTTVLTRAFAERAGVAPGAGTAQAMAAGRLRTGSIALGRVELAGLAVDDLQLLVVEELSPDLDGVIGLDFLWHFRSTTEGKHVVLRPRT